MVGGVRGCFRSYRVEEAATRVIEYRGCFYKRFGVEEAATRVIEYREGFYKSYSME